jgi:hypothetical protein
LGDYRIQTAIFSMALFPTVGVKELLWLGFGSLLGACLLRCPLFAAALICTLLQPCLLPLLTRIHCRHSPLSHTIHALMLHVPLFAGVGLVLLIELFALRVWWKSLARDPKSSEPPP